MTPCMCKSCIECREVIKEEARKEMTMKNIAEIEEVTKKHEMVDGNGKVVSEPTSMVESKEHTIKDDSDALVYLDKWDIWSLFGIFTHHLKAKYFASNHIDTMKKIAERNNKSLEETMKEYPMLTDQERMDIIRTMIKEEIKYRKMEGRPVPEDKEE